jgi:ribonuclease P protein component
LHFVRFAAQLSPNMLDHRYRFHGHSSLGYVYRKGAQARTRHISVRYIANPNRAQSRAAIVVAKKVVKAAPKRNRIRRRLYEALRAHWEEQTGSFDLVITVHSPELLVMTFPQLEDELMQVLASAQVVDSKKQKDAPKE